MEDLVVVYGLLSFGWRCCAARLLKNDRGSQTYLPLTGRWIYYLVQGLLTLACIGVGAYVVWLRFRS